MWRKGREALTFAQEVMPLSSLSLKNQRNKHIIITLGGGGGGGGGGGMLSYAWDGGEGGAKCISKCYCVEEGEEALLCAH